jgi:hypothetical protein
MSAIALSVIDGQKCCNGAERRRHPRAGVTFMAVIRAPHGFYSCLVVDLSKGGAKISFDETPHVMPGDRVTLLIDAYGEFHAEAIWHRGELAGIRFTDPPAKIEAAFHDLLAA